LCSDGCDIMWGAFIANAIGQRGREMLEARSEIFIAAPPEDVWGLISDLERGPEWSVVTLACELTSDGPPGVGSTYRSTSKFASSKVATEHVIVEWARARRIVSKVVKGAESTFTQLCHPQGEGTVLTMINRFSAPGALPGFVAERLEQQVTSTLAEELARIKEVVEASQDAGEASLEGGTS